MKTFYQKIKPFIRNYYLMAILFFVVWMVFFDSNNMIRQVDSQTELSKLKKERDFFAEEIAKNKALIKDLTNTQDPRALEKYAREHYLMKRENEDIYLIVSGKK